MGIEAKPLSVPEHLRTAWLLALERRSDLHERWKQAAGQFLSTFRTTAFDWNTAILDLLIRELDDDRLSQGMTARDAPLADLQVTLSRIWILGMYEPLRQAHTTPDGRAHEKLLELWKEFELVRVPLAKGEMRRQNKYLVEPLPLIDPSNLGKPPVMHGHNSGGYKPPTMISWDTGTVGWMVVDPEARRTKHLTRRRLSDKFLSLFD